MTRPVLPHDVATPDGHPAPDPTLAVLTWGWLSALFARPPGVEGIRAHRAGPLAALLEDLALDRALAPDVAALPATLDGDDDEVARRVAIAHGRLFDGLAGPETVPAMESAHVGEGRPFGPPVTDMERLLAAHDLSVADDAHEPADHLAIQLALMARLTAADHPDRAPLAARLAGWVPTFARACGAHDRVGFHAAAARLLATLVEREASSPSVARAEL